MRKIVLIAVVAAVLLAIGSVAGITLVARHHLGNVERLPDPFEAIPPSARPSPAAGGLTFLLIGLDTISSQATTGEMAKVDAVGRADTIMLARLSDDRRKAYVVSIPRDSWVDIPGHGKGKINAAYAWGGPSLTIQTVESLTNTRVDHVAVIDWHGFRTLTDAVGGVEVTIPADSHDPSQGVTFAKGTHRLNGERALYYVRQRHGLPNGDLDRMQRQQNFLRALMRQLLDRDTLTDPIKLNALLRAVADTVSVDRTFSVDEMLSLAVDAPKVRDTVHFVRAPVERLATKDGQSVVLLHETASAELWHSIKNDEIVPYLTQHSGDVLDETIR